jgi:hypothetical protein
VAGPVRAGGLAAATACGLAWAGCTAPDTPALPVVPIEADVRTAIVADEPSPAGGVFLTVLVEPVDGLAFTVAPVVHADDTRPPALLELNVTWQDFSGAHPIAVGRTRTLVLEWNGSEPGAPGHPARLDVHLDVGATDEVLARRVVVDGRLIGVDLTREAGRSGGQVLALPPASLEATRPVPAGSLAEHLQSGSPEGIFLAAVSAAPERYDEVLEALVESLPASGGPARNAVFAALLYLTGETHGTDIHRWRTWWSERRRGRP